MKVIDMIKQFKNSVPPNDLFQLIDFIESSDDIDKINELIKKYMSAMNELVFLENLHIAYPKNTISNKMEEFKKKLVSHSSIEKDVLMLEDISFDGKQLY